MRRVCLLGRAEFLTRDVMAGIAPFNTSADQLLHLLVGEGHRCMVFFPVRLYTGLVIAQSGPTGHIGRLDRKVKVVAK